jgi:hypothetical protein
VRHCQHITYKDSLLLIPQMTVLVAFNKMDANWRRARSASKEQGAADRGLPFNQEELLRIFMLKLTKLMRQALEP